MKPVEHSIFEMDRPNEAPSSSDIGQTTKTLLRATMPPDQGCQMAKFDPPFLFLGLCKGGGQRGDQILQSSVAEP